MKNKSEKTHMEGLLVLLLFVIFAVCILVVLLTGAGAYRRLSERGQSAYDTRTLPQYLTTKIRQYDKQGSIRVAEFAGTEALELLETVEDQTYVTRIYCYNGTIRELFSEEGAELLPGDGEVVMKAEKMELTLMEDRIEIKLSSEAGEETQLLLKLRCSE